MSRADKERKRRRRRERGGRRGAIPAALGRAGTPLVHLAYQITSEPLAAPQDGGPPRHVRDALHDEIEELHDLVRDDPAAVVERLKLLIEQYPDWGLLYNWLGAAYSRLGDMDNAEATAFLLYSRQPDYLFAKVNYAQLLLRRGDLDGVAKVFNETFDLKLLYPRRDVFHLSEFVAFCNITIEYLMRRGEVDAAHSLFDVLEELAPDHEVTRGLRSVMSGSLLLRLVNRLTLRNRRGRSAV